MDNFFPTTMSTRARFWSIERWDLRPQPKPPFVGQWIFTQTLCLFFHVVWYWDSFVSEVIEDHAFFQVPQWFDLFHKPHIGVKGEFLDQWDLGYGWSQTRKWGWNQGLISEREIFQRTQLIISQKRQIFYQNNNRMGRIWTHTLRCSNSNSLNRRWGTVMRQYPRIIDHVLGHQSQLLVIPPLYYFPFVFP